MYGFNIEENIKKQFLYIVRTLLYKKMQIYVYVNGFFNKSRCTDRIIHLIDFLTQIKTILRLLDSSCSILGQVDETTLKSERSQRSYMKYLRF